MPPTTSFTLCDTDVAASAAFSALKSIYRLVIDCEGLDLGRDPGQLSLLTIGTVPTDKTSSPLVFVFDILRLSTESLQPIFGLLSSPTYTKIVFDGRMDYAALYHEHGVELVGVLDLQLAAIQSPINTYAMLVKFMGPVMAEKKRDYKKVRMLPGLGYCISVCKVSSERGDGKVKSELSSSDSLLSGANSLPIVDHRQWLVRPLPARYLEYAANDAILIAKLYKEFDTRRYIAKRLSEQSARYITLFKGGKKSPGNGTFHSNPFLPLDILTYNERSPTKACSGCKRQLSQKCFPEAEGAAYCFVCKAVLAKAAQ